MTSGAGSQARVSPRRRGGGPTHRAYSVVVFVVLASLDNVAIGLTPPLYGRIAADLSVSEPAIALVTTITFLFSAVAAVGWAYVGDRGNRKPVLLAGTLLWAAGTGSSVLAGGATGGGYLAFLAAQAVSAIGLGAVASVGFSLVSDLISPRRRGLVMGFWGLSQGVGTLVGTLLSGVLGNVDWRRPFLLVTCLGLAAAIAYLFTYDVPPGRSEPELAGVEYDYRISRDDLPRIFARRTNVWLVLQGLTAQIAFGSLVWLPVLFRSRAQDQGYSEATAIVVGSAFATLFQLGGVLSLVGGLVGDRLQRRNPRGRALVAAVGVLAALPFYLVLFFVPMRIDVPDGAGAGAVIAAVLTSVVTEPTVAASLAAAVAALALTSANSPNWFALIADVNPPEHRGTVYSLGNLVNGVGRAGGNFLVGVATRALAASFPPPLNYAVGLAAFQLFFVPTGIMYWLASRTSPADITAVHELLAERAARSAGADRTAEGAPGTRPAR